MKPFSLGALLALLASTAMAQEPRPEPTATSVRPLRVEDLATAPTFSYRSPTVSADGQWVAYTVCDPRSIVLDSSNTDPLVTLAAGERAGCSVLVQRTSDQTARRVLAGAWESWSPSWSPDGKRLAFYADSAGAAYPWVWELSTGKSRRVGPTPVAPSEPPLWSPRGTDLLLTTPVEQAGALPAKPRRAPGDDLGAAAGPTVRVYQSAAAAARAEGRKNDSVPELFWVSPPGDLVLLEVASGQSRRLAEAVRDAHPVISPDGSQVAYLHYVGDLAVAPDGAATYTKVYRLVVVDIATCKARVLAPRVEQWTGTGLSWSPDGRLIAYLSGSATRWPYGQRGNYALLGDLFFVPVAGGKTLRVDGAPPGGFTTSWSGAAGGQLLWNASGSELYVADDHRLWRADVATRRLTPITDASAVKPDAIVHVSGGGRPWVPAAEARQSSALHYFATDSTTKRSGLYRADMATGAVKRVWAEDGWHWGAVGDGAGRQVVFLRETTTEPMDAWTVDGRDTSARRLTTVAPRLARYTYGTARLVAFRSAEGQPLRGSLLLPAAYVAGRRYPLVVWVYPSDFGSAGLNAFGMVGASGFNMQILATRGYAVLFPDVPIHVRGPVADMMSAVMPAIDRAVDIGVADPGRLAVMGSSNGGYATIALLTQTRRFKAGVMNAGFGNLAALYGSMTINGTGSAMPLFERYTSDMGAPPWVVPQRYLQNSPVYYLDRVVTPLLIQAGSADGEFTTGSNEVFVGLKRLGRDVTYLQYQGEGHWLQRPANQLDYWTRVTRFLDRHLRASTDPKPKSGRN